MVKDTIETVGHTRVQHGKLNDRIYVLDYKHALDPYLINRILLLAEEYDYGKIIVKIPKEARLKLLKHHFKMEAMIPGFYHGKNPCLFMSKYCKKSRAMVANEKDILSILDKLKQERGGDVKELNPGYSIRVLTEKDVGEMVHVYKAVFETYPFPIHDEEYLEETMLDETIYFGVFESEKLVGISSCEMNKAEEHVEMTDFAVLPGYRGKQLAKHLLMKMEQAMLDMGIKTAFTIARSISRPMNATFSGAGYRYGGTLWNNTQISGKIESMNIWYKPLCEEV